MSVFHGIFAGASNAFGFVAEEAIPAPEEFHFRKLRAKSQAPIIQWQALVLRQHRAEFLKLAQVAVG